MDNITKKDRRKSMNFPEYSEDLNKKVFEQQYNGSDKSSYRHFGEVPDDNYSMKSSMYSLPSTKPLFTCNICNISNSDSFIVLGCNHVFHIKCLAHDQLILSRKCEIIDNESFFNLIKCNCCGYLLDSTEILHIQLKNYKSSNTYLTLHIDKIKKLEEQLNKLKDELQDCVVYKQKIEFEQIRSKDIITFLNNIPL